MDKFSISGKFPEEITLNKILISGTLPVPDDSQYGWSNLKTIFDCHKDDISNYYEKEMLAVLKEFYKTHPQAQAGNLLLEVSEYEFYELEGIYPINVDFGECCSQDASVTIEWSFTSCKHIVRGNMAPILAEDLLL